MRTDFESLANASLDFISRDLPFLQAKGNILDTVMCGQSA